ncbi:hypothetical protein OHC50_16170 [Paenarthrobacter ilicis]|uniref:hypothetical protein n=1 Tax=Paenarthrobacter ilicis TaxID=43665 RepID=UPI00300BD7BE
MLSGNNAGNAYNKVMLGSLWENHKNLVLENTPAGYTNQNLFIGGRLQHSTTRGAVLDDVNACQIYMVSTNGEGGPNNNTFINTSFEGENVAFYRIDIAGAYNTFYNCRWESPGGVQPRIRYRASALKNKIHGGYGLFNCVEVFDGTQGGGEIMDSEGAYTSAQNTAAQVIPNNVWTDITTWTAPTQRRCSYNAATGEFTPRPGRWEINAEVTFAKNSTGRRQAAIIVAGSNIGADEISPGAERTKLKANGEFRFNGVQTFKVQALQTSGADLALEGTSGYVKVRAKYLGY